MRNADGAYAASQLILVCQLLDISLTQKSTRPTWSSPPTTPTTHPLSDFSQKSGTPTSTRWANITIFNWWYYKSNLEHIIYYICIICNWIKLKNGDLCVSILHPPVDDPQSGELPCERWDILCFSVFVNVFINIDFYLIIQVESHSERPHNSPVSGNKLECL